MVYFDIGRHYFVSIEEEDNLVWDSVGYWTKYPDDGEGRGRQEFAFVDDVRDIPYEEFPFHYKDYHSARLAATTILDKHFDNRLYDVHWHDYTGEDVDGWCYVGKHGE